MTQQGVTIPIEDGIALASQRNPWAEASKWADRIAVIPARAQVVLGLGAGVHILELARRTSEKIYVVDPRQNLFADFANLLNQEIEAEQLWQRIQVGPFDKIWSSIKSIKYQVQSFQPAWGHRSEEFLNYKDQLNLRDPKMAAAFFGLKKLETNELVSIKAINSNQESILILQEMIR